MASTSKRKPPTAPRRRPADEDTVTDPVTTPTPEDVESAFEEVRSRVAAQRGQPQTARTRANFAAARAATADLTPEVIVQQVSTTGLEIQRALDDVCARVIAEEKRLADLRTAAAAYEAELETLYGKETAGAALEVLVEQHGLRIQALEQQYTERKRVLDEKLEQQIREMQAATEAEERRRETEEANYTFETQQKRRAAEDAWNQAQAAKNRAAQERAYELERGWAQREEVLKEREKELANLRALAEGMEARIRKEVNEAVGAATNALKREHEANNKLAASEAHTRLALALQQNQSLASQMAGYVEQIKRLENQLDAQRVTVQEIAKSAMHEAGSSKALAELTSFARDNSTTSRKS